jgi:hypothetical protein
MYMAGMANDICMNLHTSVWWRKKGYVPLFVFLKGDIFCTLCLFCRLYIINMHVHTTRHVRTMYI